MNWLKRILNLWPKKAPLKEPADDFVQVPLKPIEETYPSDGLQELIFNQYGLELVQHFEGFYSKAYICPGGKITQGWGSIKKPNGEPIKLTDPPIDKETALIWLEFEIREKADYVKRFCAKHSLKLNSNQFSALVSFVYNLGIGHLTESSALGKAVISGDLEKIRAAFKLYTKVTKRAFGIPYKKEEPGLVRRRIAEFSLYNRPV